MIDKNTAPDSAAQSDTTASASGQTLYEEWVEREVTTVNPARWDQLDAYTQAHWNKTATARAAQPVQAGEAVAHRMQFADWAYSTHAANVRTNDNGEFGDRTTAKMFGAWMEATRRASLAPVSAQQGAAVDLSKLPTYDPERDMPGCMELRDKYNDGDYYKVEDVQAAIKQAAAKAPAAQAECSEVKLHLWWRTDLAEWRECMPDADGAVEFVGFAPAGYAGVDRPAPAAQAVEPEGWQLVPKKLTDKMQGVLVFGRTQPAHNTYLNLLAVAPKYDAPTASPASTPEAATEQAAECKRCGGEAMIYVEEATTPCPDCQDLSDYDEQDDGDEAMLLRAEAAHAQQPAAPGVTNAEIHTLRRLIECAEKLNERPRPMCRDCADENGTCPNSGLECDMGKLFADAKRLHNNLAAPTAGQES